MKEILSKRFPLVAVGTADLYVYFFNIGLDLLKDKGVFIYITLNKFLKTKYGVKLRNLLSSEYDVDNIIDFFELPVFDASTDVCITKIINSKGKRKTKYYPVKTLENLNLFEITAGGYQEAIKDEEEWKFIDCSQKAILEKIYKDTISLGEFTNNTIFYGVKTGANNIFIIDKNTKEKIVNLCDESKKYIHPYVEPTKFNKWEVEDTNKYIIGTFPSLQLDINKIPGIKSYLIRYKNKLEPKPKNHFGKWSGRKSGSYKWFETQDNIKYWPFLFKPKLIYIHTARNHQFYYDTEGRVINNSCYLISCDSKLLFAFLNSKLFSWLKKIKFVAYGDASESGRAKLDYNKMVTVPIKKKSDKIEGIFEDKINLIKNKREKGLEISDLEVQLDAFICKLYELTYDEVKVIDSEFPLSKEEYDNLELK